jgi:hypothetical protein
MRLLKRDDDGYFNLVDYNNNSPPYAILSHTWGTGKDDEVTFNDIVQRTGSNKPGFTKLEFCYTQALADGLHYFWVETCSIDKSNSTELQTAINSMFRWYQDAARCYVYLSDVSVYAQNGESHVEWESAFRKSRWFTRGWTLQELLAPKSVAFYSREGIRLGDKQSHEHQIHKITGVAIEALQGRDLRDFSVQERLQWGEKRLTTKEEDAAYCLLGIFNIFLPLIYGESRENAMDRLQREILTSSSTRSVPLSGM